MLNNKNKKLYKTERIKKLIVRWLILNLSIIQPKRPKLIKIKYL